MEKQPRNHESNITYNIDYRNVKYPRLEFKTGILLLVLPKKYKNETTLLEKHQNWIQKKNHIIQTALEEAQNKTLNMDRTNEDLKEIVHSIVTDFQQELNLKVNNIYFRKMKTKWGSCSPRRNLTINTLLKHLPKTLIEYVIYHEMTHLIQKNHNDKFWKIISSKFKNYQEKEKELLVYWFLIQNIIGS